ncbi:E3 ubiquitin-protein ligase SH3RF3-like [Glandiceps talaboti]
MDEDRLNDLLECSVCLDRLDQTSKVLPCQHTFCKRCLEEIYHSRGELRCPECRVLVQIPVDQLPTNILLIRLLEGIRYPGARTSVFDKQSSYTRPEASAVTLGSHVPAKNTLSGVKHVKESTSKPCARALFDFDAKEAGDLSFKKDDLIHLLKKIDENWYQGDVNGQIGFLPSNYIHVLIPIPRDPPQCKAKYDFDLRDQDGKDCLTFSKGDIFSVIKRVDDNWAEGQRGDKIGIFPLSYVELNEAACNMLGKISINSVSSFHVANTTTTGAPSTTTSTVTTNITNAVGLEEQNRNKSALKRNSFTLSPIQISSKNSTPSSKDSDRVDIGAPVLISTSSVRASNLFQSHQQPQLSSADVRNTPQNRPDGQNQVASGGGGVLVPTPVLAAATTIEDKPKSPQLVYRAMYSYKPVKSDELELKKGELYKVLEKCQDGWYKGVSLQDGAKGVFPGNYVKVYKPEQSQIVLAGTGTKESLVTVTHGSGGEVRQGSPRSSRSGSTGNKFPIRIAPPPPTKRKSDPAPLMSASMKATTHSRPSSSCLQPKQFHNSSATSSVVLPHRSATMAHSPPPPPPTSTPPIPSSKKKDKDRTSKFSIKKLMKPGTRLTISNSVSGSHGRSESMPEPFQAEAVAVNHRKSESLDESVGAVGNSRPHQPPATTPFVRERYRVITPYPPQSADELELKVGDTVFVHQKGKDGWFKGTLQRTGKTGLFPGIFVEHF